MMPPELRCDPVTGQWVGVYTDNSFSPSDYPKGNHRPPQKAICQFCLEKEHLTPPEVDAVRLQGSAPNRPGWQVRVVPNKFPALRIEGNLDSKMEGILEMTRGIGAHEVVIESPDHNKNLCDLREDELTFVIQKYQSRFIDLSKDKRFRYIVIFKNYGESAGASVEHPHTQIIALPMIPQAVLEEIKGAHQYYVKHKACVFCDMIKQEEQDKVRIITQNEHFIVFCPFVSKYPFECWIMPKQHQSQFHLMPEAEQRGLAGAMKEILLRLKVCLSDPSYNFYLHCSSTYAPRASRSFHWHMEIIPKLTPGSGFEWGTGFYIATTEPSLAAGYLREVHINS